MSKEEIIKEILKFIIGMAIGAVIVFPFIEKF